VVDNEDVDGSVGRLELKAELTLEGSAEGRGGVADIWIGRPVPVKGEVVEADEAGLVSSTSQGRHSNSRYSPATAHSYGPVLSTALLPRGVLSLHSNRKFAILMPIALLWDCRAAGAMPKFEGCLKHSNKKGCSLSASCRWT
jgi:hypothetical protein